MTSCASGTVVVVVLGEYEPMCDGDGVGCGGGGGGGQNLISNP